MKLTGTAFPRCVQGSGIGHINELINQFHYIPNPIHFLKLSFIVIG